MKIGIIGAMDVEIKMILHHCKQVVEHMIGQTMIYTGLIEDQNVVIMKCGIGKVNAAMGTQMMIDLFKVEAIINTGVAGAIDKQLKIGDIVLSSKVAYHDVDVTNFGYQKGQIPTLPLWFEADQKLIEIIQTLHKVILGPIVSGDQFVCDNDKKEQIKHTFNALCTEMEGAAIAQVASLQRIPFVIVRAISDQADSKNPVAYEYFEQKAAQDSAELVLNFVKYMAHKLVL